MFPPWQRDVPHPYVGMLPSCESKGSLKTQFATFPLRRPCCWATWNWVLRSQWCAVYVNALDDVSSTPPMRCQRSWGFQSCTWGAHFANRACSVAFLFSFPVSRLLHAQVFFFFFFKPTQNNRVTALQLYFTWANGTCWLILACVWKKKKKVNSS